MPLKEKRRNDETTRNSLGGTVFKDEDKTDLKKTSFKTSLTLVVSDDSQDAVRKQKETPTKSDYSLLLSGLYAIIIILIGFLFPLAEALQDMWLQTEYVAAFLVYIYTVSTIFLLFMQGLLWHSVFHKHHETASPSEGHPTGQGHSSGGHSSSLTNNNSRNESPRVNSPSSNALAITEFSHEGAEKSPHKAKKHLAKHRSMTAMVRYSSSVNLNSKETEKDFSSNIRNFGGIDRQTSQLSQGSDFGHENFGEVVDEEFEMWIDMSKLGSIFSHEGSSFYLRLGSLFFGIGHIIYVCLEIENSSRTPSDCDLNTYWWTYIIRLIYIVVQTFFLFKNQSVHVHKFKVIVRFGYAHLIATNFCVWLRTLINEIMQEYHHISHLAHEDHGVGGNSSTLPSLVGHHSILKRAAQTDDGGCSYYRGILQSAAIYLFPFVLEYSLIAMGTFAIIYHHIDEETKDDMVRGLTNFFKVQAIDLSGAEKADKSEGSEGHEGGHGTSVFSKSHTGMFGGIILLAACIVSIILFFFAMDNEADVSKAELIYLTSDLILHSILLVTAAAAIVRIHHLSYIAKPFSIDDMLLYLSMSGTLILEIGVTIASGNSISHMTGTANNKANEVLRLCDSIVAAIQTIAQVIVVLSGMRRYPSKASHVTDMPGRGLITFLVVGNVTVWIFRTLQAKELSLQDTQSEFYGNLAWLLLMNVNLPLLLFYRFHSSICLADVWMIAYTPLHQKVAKPHEDKHQQHEGLSPTHSEPPGDPRSNSIIRSVSVQQLYRPGPGRKSGMGLDSAAVLELDNISHVSSVSSLTNNYAAHRF